MRDDTPSDVALATVLETYLTGRNTRQAAPWP
jgi:hypothetical protein